MVLWECRKHYRNAPDLYAACYLDRQQKSHVTFKRLADRLYRFGTVKQTRVKRRPIVNENNVAAVLAFAALNPHASSRQMEKKSGISQRSVLRILHQHKLHPYRMSLHQDLYGNDFLKRVNFCNWIHRKMRTDVSFLSHVLFSDEGNSKQIREMWIGIICIIEQMRILDGLEVYHFNISGPLIVLAALSANTSLVHIFLKVAWLGKFTQTFCKTYCLN